MSAEDYLFDPKTVEHTLKVYPFLRHSLPNPADEGLHAIHFRARETARQIYRILTNQHYPHLVDLLRALERCLMNGYRQPKLLRTKAHQEYGSALAEIFIAQFFIGHGFKVHNLDETKASVSTPDMLVESEALSLSVEVYSPRDWGGMEDFVDELRVGILNLDVPWNFRFEIRLGVLTDFSDSGQLLRFDPWKFSEATEHLHERTQQVESILHDIESALKKSVKPQTIRRADTAHNTLTEVRIMEIGRSNGHMPHRSGCIFYSLSGYAPEGMFDQLVQRRILRKIRKGQAESLPGEHVRILFIDISRLGYSREFEHPWYHRKFEESIQKHIDSATIDLNWVIFSCPNLATETMWFPLVLKKSSISDDLDYLFGRAQLF